MNDLSLHILDIANNAFEAGASNLIIKITETSSYWDIKIIDNGKGLTSDEIKAVIDPFYTSRTTRKVGLGIPLFKQTLEQTGGFLDIKSIPHLETVIHGLMYKEHWDALPIGDLVETIYILLVDEREINLLFEYINNDKVFVFDSREIKAILDGVPLTEYRVMQFLKSYLAQGINEQ